MNSIDVLSAGFYTTIQDQGRKGVRSFGIPVSGAMDQLNADLGNKMLGNSLNAAVLEITMTGPKLLFNHSANICITGADMSADINGRAVKTNIGVTVEKGEILKFGKLKYGFRSYLCIKGGFESPAHFGSSSTYEKASLGYPVLKKGTELFFSQDLIITQFSNSRVKPIKNLFHENIIKVMKSPEYHLMNESLLNEYFEITIDSNRMGYRLRGKGNFSHDHSILTSTVIPGTVQLPPSGDPVVLMKDCQTTGGYPRILQVSEMGINILAQKKPGDLVKFEL